MKVHLMKDHNFLNCLKSSNKTVAIYDYYFNFLITHLEVSYCFRENILNILIKREDREGFLPLPRLSLVF